MLKALISHTILLIMIYSIFPFLAISIWTGVLSLNLYVSLYSSSNQESQFDVVGNTKQQVLRRSKVSTMNDVVMEDSSVTSSTASHNTKAADAMQYYDLHHSGTKIIVNITTDDDDEVSRSSSSCECELMSVDCLDSIRCLLLQNRDTRQHRIAAGVFTRHLIKLSSMSSSSPRRQDFYLFDYANTPIGKALQYDAIETWGTLKEGRGIGRRDVQQEVHDPFIDDTNIPYCVKHNLLGRSCVYRSYYQNDIDEEEELDALEEKALNNYDAKLLSILADNPNNGTCYYDEIHYQMRTQTFMTFAHLVRILFNRQPHVREFYKEHVKTIKGVTNDQLPTLRVSLHIRRADSW